MTGSTPNAALRGRIETAIRIVSPLLDLVPLVGARISRLLERAGPDYALARLRHDGGSAPRGLRSR